MGGYDFEIEIPPGNVCDFCSTTIDKEGWVFKAKPDWQRHIAKDMRIDLVGDGKWLACTPCKALVEAEDIKGLHRRFEKRMHQAKQPKMPRRHALNHFRYVLAVLEPHGATPWDGVVGSGEFHAEAP